MRIRISGLPLVAVMMIAVGGLMHVGRRVARHMPALPITPVAPAPVPAPAPQAPARPTSSPEMIKPAKPEDFVGIWQPVPPSRDSVAKVRKEGDGYVLVPYPGQRVPLRYRENRMIFEPCGNGSLEKSPYLMFDQQTGRLLMKSSGGHTMGAYTRQ